MTKQADTSSLNAMSSPRKPLPISPGKWVAWLTLAVSLALSVVAWQMAKSSAAQEAREHFEFHTSEIKEAMYQRLLAYKEVLHGVGGFFYTAQPMTREKWRQYVAHLQVEKIYPGILGIGFAQRVPLNALAAHIRHVRAEGFTDYTVWPLGKRREYTAIVYLEPFHWRNQRAHGYDMHIDPIRRRAMAQARDYGKATVSSKIKLMQETGHDIQAGFVMYLPLYRRGAPLDTVAQRRAALWGYVYSPFRMNDLINGVLGKIERDVGIAIYDGATITPQTLMYRDNAPRRSVLVTDEVLHFEGHRWTLRFFSLPEFDARINRQKSRLVLGAGVVISFLLFAMTAALANTRTRALRLAHAMTAASRESEARLQEVSSTLGEGVYMTDCAGNILFTNPEAQRLLGWPEEEMQGRQAHALFHHHRADGSVYPVEACALDQANPDAAAYVAEDVFWRRDGARLPVSVNSAPILREGTQTGWVVAFHDISEQLAIREKLNRTLSEQQAILETAVVGIAYLKGSEIAWANTKMGEIFGYSTEELNGLPLDATYPSSEEAAAGNQAAAAAFAAANEYSVERLAKRRDGTLVWCHFNGRPVDRGKPREGAIWTAHDITERKLAEKALRDQQRDQQVIFDSVRAMIWYIDRDGNVLRSNRLAERYVGMAAGDMAGKSVFDLLPPAVAARYHADTMAVIASGREMLGTIEPVPRPDGSAGWFQSDKIPIHDENGEVVGVTIFVTDVSERLRAEEELKRLNEVLEQRVAAEAAKNREKDLLLIQQSRLAAMGEMMGNIAHQWRQPLNALGVLLSNVRDAYDFGELDGAMLDHSITDGRRLIQKMSTTIDDFRNFFRPNRQKVAFSLQDAVEEAIALVDASFKNNNIVIHFQRGEEVKIIGFPNEFSQVLLNLLSNAKDVLGSKAGQREVSIQVSCAAGSVRVAVHDNGGGIPGSVLPKIFDPYFTTREKGTGIGLYMSKMIVENMDGSIFARNIGDGAEITIELPLSGDSTQQQTPPA